MTTGPKTRERLTYTDWMNTAVSVLGKAAVAISKRRVVPLDDALMELEVLVKGWRKQIRADRLAHERAAARLVKEAKK